MLSSLGLFAALALLLASPASASKGHNFKEVFGSAQQPVLIEGGSAALDQSSGDLLVVDRGNNTLKRFKPDGSPDNFSALATNVIDGKEGPDATPQNGLSIGPASESQIAVDNSGTATDGNIYVTHGSPNAIDIFSETGAYLGQLTKAGPTTNLSEACGVAVDSAGAVYVGDYTGGIRKYVPSANPPVNTDNTATFTTTSTPCTLAAGAGPTAGFLFPAQYSGPISKIDSSTGELKYSVASGSHTTVAVDPGTGHVFGAAGTTLQEFDASGALSAISLSATPTEGVREIRGIGVNETSGLIYLSRQLRLEVYEAPIVTAPEPVTTAATNETGARATLNGTVNPDGVELSECFFEWGVSNNSATGFENTIPCVETPAAIGAGTSPEAVHADISGLLPQGATYYFRLVAKNPAATIKADYQQFNTPNTVSAQAATAITATTATLNGTVNPDGETLTQCIFEWGPEKASGTSIQTYPEAAPCVPGPGGITGTSPVSVHADISDLDAGSTYRYHLKVTYPAGTVIADDKTLQTAGPVIEGTWSEDVIHTEATLKAQISPAGSATTYRFEWGESTAYGSESEGNVGSDSSSHEVAAFLAGLKPGTTYHYRVIATSGIATNEGPDHTFTTYVPFVPETDCPNQGFRFGASAALPECRAYEMVSPVDKNGGDIRSGENPTSVLQRYIQSSLDGEKITYSALTAFGDAPAAYFSNQYIASRGAEGWSSHGINPPLGRNSEGTFGGGPSLLADIFRGFTPDLSSGWFFDYNATPLSPGAVDEGAGTKNIYRRDNTDGTYHALGLGRGLSLTVDGFTADLSHVLITAFNQTYDYSGGQPHLIGILPDGTPTVAPAAVAGSLRYGTERRYRVNLTHVISDDGSRVFWSAGNEGEGTIYMRENPAAEQSAIAGDECTELDKACTTQVSAGLGEFWAANPEGSKVLYSEGPLFSGGASLKLTDVDAETTRTIAGKVRGVSGASDDLSRVYFVSEEALAPGAGMGERNLYLDEEGTVSFIAVLSADDTNSLADRVYSDVSSKPASRSTRVTPDGEHLAFMSKRSLTGYDNTDVSTGEAAYEVYLYDAGAEELTCVSCKPSGARPRGGDLYLPYNARVDVSQGIAAAWLNTYEHSLHGAPALTSDGRRLFFNAYDALVPQDTNGAADVYEWRSQGTASCEKPDGCIDLLSSGQSPDKSEFLDATADGRDVFFETNSSLLPQDPGLIDIYDARADGGYPPEPAPPIPCNGDACQSPPSPPNDPTPASAGFKGKGNPVPSKARRSCKPRKRHAGKRAHKKAKHKKQKSCRRAKRGANR